MARYNDFLAVEARREAKGGVRTIETPGQIENFVFQTRAGPLDPFEDRLAGDLMEVFGAGAEEIDDVVAGLNGAGSLDSGGRPWTADSFRQQMAVSAAGLFAPQVGSSHE